MKLVKENDYFAVPVQPLWDSNLSLEAKGILATLYSMPNRQNLTGYEIASACRIRIDQVIELEHELERAGYLAKENGLLLLKDSPK